MRTLSKIKNVLIRIYKILFKLCGQLLPKKQNLIIFESFFGKSYSDNPRAIYEYLKQHHPEFKLIWSADKRYLETFKKHSLPFVKRFSIKWLFFMTRAKYWVVNSRMPLWLAKPKQTIYVQTWHGTPLKKLGIDIENVQMPGTNTEAYKKNFLYEANKWDYLISPNRYSTEIFRRAFGFQKTIVESGYPRNDFLINHNNPEAIKKIKRQMNLPLDKKIILYAPTWRDNQFYSKGKYKFDLQIDLQKLQSIFGDNYIFLLRLHYLVAENLDLTPYQNFAFDFSKHDDIRELYLISDILITDYSSVFFDYANLKRPMLFYVYDIDHYRDHLRGFYFEFEKYAPGPLVKTTNELIDEIQKIEELGIDSTDQKFEDFYVKFCSLEDGNASKRVVETIFIKDSM